MWTVYPGAQLHHLCRMWNVRHQRFELNHSGAGGKSECCYPGCQPSRQYGKRGVPPRVGRWEARRPTFSGSELQWFFVTRSACCFCHPGTKRPESVPNKKEYHCTKRKDLHLHRHVGRQHCALGIIDSRPAAG